MKRIRLNQRERTWMNTFAVEAISLREDWQRRLRNALIALSSMDPAWMIWVDQHIASPCHVPAAARAVEVRARELLLQRYNSMSPSLRRDLVNGDLPFSDEGNLISG